MSLINKIFITLFLVIGFGVFAALMGLRTVDSIDNTLNKIIEFEFPVEQRFGDIETNIQVVTIVQRTLMDGTLDHDVRQQQLDVLHKELEVFNKKREEVAALLAQGASQVYGWREIQAKWSTLQKPFENWIAMVQQNLKAIKDWEDTTILNPDSLLRNIMQYRGDHFQLAARLGAMIGDRSPGDVAIDPADDACAFGQWRKLFEAGQEEYSKNSNLRAIMSEMTAPHRTFHQTAANVQKLLHGDFDKNREEVLAEFRKSLAAARQVIDTFSKISDEVDRARELYSRAEHFTMNEMRQSRADTLRDLQEVIDFDQMNMEANLNKAKMDGATGVRNMKVIMLITLGVGLLFSVLLYLTIRKNLTRPLTTVIGQLSAVADEVSDGAVTVAKSSNALASGAQDQAAALEETSAAIEEITSTARINLDNAKRANKDVRENGEEITSSVKSVGRMSVAMQEIQESSEKIGTILKTIEEIAFQTNLLALNAAVEAARAGEAGKGFAVVADEVRNLAGRSAQAVRDTSTLIETTVERVRNGTAITHEIEQTFEKIAENASEITQLMEDIDHASGEQAQGLDQVNQAIATIDNVNQHNVLHAKANAEAGDHMNHDSAQLLDQIESLDHVLENILGKKGLEKSRKKKDAGNAAIPTVSAKIAQTNNHMYALPPPSDDF